MLEALNETRKQIETSEAQLEEQKAQLEELKAEQEAKQEELQLVMDAKQAELERLWAILVVLMTVFTAQRQRLQKIIRFWQI